MEQYRNLDDEEIIIAATKVLARTPGDSVLVSRVDTISNDRRRNLVLRAIARRSDGSEEPIIIKVTRFEAYDPAASNVLHTSGLVREWAATALLKQQANAGMLVSRFLGGDADIGLIILQDLGSELPTLVEPLMGARACVAEKAIQEYATALGNLHAQTAGCEDTYDQIVQTAFPHAATAKESHLSTLTRSMESIRRVLGGAFDKTELTAIAEKLDRPRQWQALVHGDLCPDNVLFREGRACLIDFEFAQPGHALLDAAYLWMGFPTCWCAGRLTESLARQAEQVYLETLRASDRFSFDESSYQLDLAHICAAQMLGRTARFLDKAIASDEEWGIASVRDRVLWWLRSSCIAMDEAQVLPSLNALAEGWIEDLQGRWISSDFLGYYPAFQNSGSSGQ